MEQTNSAAMSRDERFINEIITRCQQDKGFAARLRRADNPLMEYQSWELLAKYGIDLERSFERLPFVTVAAAMAKSKADSAGDLSLGAALAASFPDGNNSDQAKARLRRLLACDDLEELCRVLRPVFSLVDSRCSQNLDYLRLLKQLKSFNFDPGRIKAQWAQEFYRTAIKAGDE